MFSKDFFDGASHESVLRLGRLLKRFANAVPASDTEGRMWDTGGEAMLTEN